MFGGIRYEAENKKIEKNKRKGKWRRRRKIRSSG